MSLEEIESQLNPRDFFRVNRQTIISIHALSGLKTWFGGKLRVRLTNYPDTEVLCSREKASALKPGWGDKSCSDIQITFHHQLLQIPNKLRKFAKGTRMNALWSC